MSVLGSVKMLKLGGPIPACSSYLGRWLQQHLNDAIDFAGAPRTAIIILKYNIYIYYIIYLAIQQQQQQQQCTS